LTTFRNSRVPCFNICSTPLRPVYDPVYAREALKTRRTLAKCAYHVLKRSFRIIDRLAWKRFSGVVATSQEVKDRIVKNRLFPNNERMILRYPGIDKSAAPKTVEYQPYLLVPGRITWTKNITLAVEAFKQAGLPHPWRLVIAGFVDHKSKIHFEELKGKAKGCDRIEFVVSPSDAELSQLYTNAYAVLFTPLNEDWGMAVLEGMLHSKPVMANASGGPCESVQSGRTGWLLPAEPGPWAEQIRKIVQEPSLIQQMGRAARASVEKYDWPQFVQGVDDLIEAHVLSRKAP
jgi:glycosyltransferase involved in cell wall biosynthesis